MLIGRASGHVIALVLLIAAALAPAAQAIVVAPFTANGTYVRPPGPPSFQIGSGGFVEEIDAFLAGPGDALASQLSQQSPPAGLSLAFSSALSPDATDLLLIYDVTNAGAVALAGITFGSFFDAEIDETLNTFFNEFGETDGVLAAGQSFEIDEPGYTFGDIFTNLRASALDDTNAVPQSEPEDVSMALAFVIANLDPGQTVRFEMLLSEDGDSLASFALRQRDGDADSTTVITFSGRASVVPEPGTLLLLGAGLIFVAARRNR